MLDNRIANVCPDGILTIDAKGRITGLNDAARKMFGWPGDSLIGQNLNVLVPHGQRRRHQRAVRGYVEGTVNPQKMADWRGIAGQRRDGSRFPLKIWLTSDVTSGEHRTVAFIRDMSETARLQRALAEDEAKLARRGEQNALLALVAEHATDSVIITDAEGLTLWVNPATEKLSGYKPDEFAGRKPGDLLQGPDTDPAIVRDIGEAVRRGEGICCELLNYKKSGESYWIEMNVSPIRDADGRIDKFIAVERDITERKQQQRELEEARAKAERAEHRLMSAVEAINEGFAVYDADDRLVMANQAFRRLHEAVDDLIVPGAKFEDIVLAAARRGHFDTSGEDPQDWVRKQVEARRRDDHVETIVQLSDGRWMHRSEQRTPEGEMIGIRADVTKFKQQEQRLREAKRQAEQAEARFASAIEAISEGFVIYDADDRLVMCNRAFRDQFPAIADRLIPGAKFDELTRYAAQEGIFDTEGEDAETWTRRQIERRKAEDRVETIIRFTDGCWLMRRDCRTPAGETIGIRTDITELKQQELRLTEALRKAERAEGRLASAIEAISEGFVIYDEYDRLVMANEAYKKMRADDADIIQPGVTFEELVRTAVARGHFDTEGEDPDVWVRKQVEARRAEGNVETMVRFTDGRWMLRRERRTPQGEMIGIRSDITAFKQQEAALEQARREAEAADRAKSEFVANISHELRTPINGIVGFNQLMLAGELSDKQRERAAIIKASSEHLLQLVNDLLDLSRIASNSVELEPAPLDVSELSNEVIELMSPLAAKNSLTIEARIDVPAGARIEGDRSRIKQILLNLVGNAIKFTEHGGVTLKVDETSGGIAFAVADTGPGMPEDKLQGIFHRFSQLKHQRSGIQGAGLGLAITKGLVDLMGGEIDVQSELGKGSVFTARLPLPLMPPEDDPDKPRAVKKKSAAGKRRPEMYDVLVAEDHPFNQVLISEILDSIGCRVTMAENGREAVDQIEANAFDVIIMDNQMPVMSGLEAIRHIRARTDWKTRIPILALTANAMRGAEKDYEAHGVEQFMTKPLDVNRVIEAVKQLGSAGRKVREEASSAVD